MRNAPGFSMPEEMAHRLLTPLRKFQSEHHSLSLSSPAPTVRVPDPASRSDSYLVFIATLVISLSSAPKMPSVRLPSFDRGPQSARVKNQATPPTNSLSLAKHSLCACARSPHTPLRHFAAVSLSVRPQPVTSPL
jgi:hypothetical protein